MYNKPRMNKLFSNIRFYVLLFSLAFSFFVYLYIAISIPTPQLQIIRLTQIYSLTSLAFLYLALLAGPFCFIFKELPFCGQYLKARRAIGVSAFYFALLHSSFAFFGQLGGLHGLGFLSNKYLLAITLSFTALVILGLMAATSFDFMIAKLTFLKWKLLHQFIYLAGILVLIHAVMLGTHFEKLYEFIPQIIFTAVAFLLFLEIMRLDNFFKKKYPSLAQSSILSIPLYTLLSLGAIYFLFPVSGNSGLSFGIHAQHVQLARDAQQGTSVGLQGDRAKRFTVSINHPPTVIPGRDTPLSFEVYDASSGNKVDLFSRLNDKIVHLIIVDSELKYFTHIHPDQDSNEFKISTKFPHPGRYHLYLDFQPSGAIEQQIAFVLDVGKVESPAISNLLPDTKLTKVFEDYEVTLDYPKPLRASKLSLGEQVLTYTVSDAKTKQPITTLKPYLSAFGHAVMINQETFDYLHVHPNDSKAPYPDQNGGPKVEFMPLGLYGPIKPGIYRVFAQFNPDDHLFTTDFTIKID